MTVGQLRSLLIVHDDNAEVVVNGMKIIGKYTTRETYEEFINSAGGTWEGGCGTAPDGRFCGECSSFDCDRCNWKERK